MSIYYDGTETFVKTAPSPSNTVADDCDLLDVIIGNNSVRPFLTKYM
jgi:hypothetical protein